MPAIRPSYVETVAYLYASPEAARDGRMEGGTGFAISVPFANSGLHHPYIVTNRHVIDDGFLTVRVNVPDGDYEVISSVRGDWVDHPYGYDLSVKAVRGALGMNWGFTSLPHAVILTEEKLERLNIGIGDELFLLSRFVGQEGRSKNLPVLHTGVISRHVAPVANTRTKSDEPSFLVETYSKPGYSGSPVLGYISPASPLLGVKRDTKQDIFLLGVVWGYPAERLPVFSANPITRDPGHQQEYVNVPTGMAAVTPAWFISDILNSDRFVTEREALEAELKERYTHVASVEPASASLDTESAVDMAQDLAQKLF